MTKLHRVSLQVPRRAVDTFWQALEPDCLSVATFEDAKDDTLWLIEGVASEAPDLDPLKARLILAAELSGCATPPVTVEPLPDRDWLQHIYALLKPIHVGRFFIHGSHYTGCMPAGARALRIDAATAFGSGEHETTRACLIALNGLIKQGLRPARVLDMGCGSGILGLAAAAHWRCPVDAIDIDPESVRMTRLNARRNHLAPYLRAQTGDGYNTPLARQGRPYDLIFANILARPLIRMAPSLKTALRPGGTAILSGLLDRQEAAVMAAHRTAGLRLVRRVSVGAWRGLVIRR